LLPGDWSNIPFPMARPIRSSIRALQNGTFNPIVIAEESFFGPQGRGGIGIIRDANLTIRGIQDTYKSLADEKKGQWDNLYAGLQSNGVAKKPPNFTQLWQTPTLDPTQMTP
jgi:hypothetical protein